MDDIRTKKRVRDFLPTRRRLIQLYAALLHNANLKGYIQGEIYTGRAKTLCVPGLNCYSCPGAAGACPLGALQNALASTGNRAPYYMLGILLLLGLTLGRTICGFLCPFGLLQELLHKIPAPKLKKSRFTRALSYLKYVILAVFVLAIPLYYAAQHVPMPGFCKYICPAGTFGGALGLLAHPVNADKFSMLNILFTRKFVIMVLVFGVCVFVYRAFCRFLCPLGAIYGLFSRIALVGVRVEPDKCTSCGLCVGGCKMDVRRVGDHECIHCAGCVDLCPTQAISMRAGKAVLYAGKKAEEPRKKALAARRAVAWALALAVLAGVLVYFNAPRAEQQPAPSPSPAPTEQAAAVLPADGPDAAASPDEPKAPPAEEPDVTAPPDIPEGSQVGMRGPAFTAPLYGGGTFDLADTRGRVTVLNFWATWCTPCVNELPYFEQLHQTYGEDVAILAVHSDLVTDDVEEYLSLFDYTIPFALDDSGVVAAYGGSTMLPQTVVLDRDGVIVYNQVGSVTYQSLDAIVSPLLDR